MAINDYSRLVVVIMKIGEKIKNLRTEQNMTQKKFAEKTGLSISSVQKYEYGDFIPSESVIIKIAKAFNISISEFLKNTTEYADTDWYTDIAIDEFLKNRVSLSDEINDHIGVAHGIKVYHVLNYIPIFPVESNKCTLFVRFVKGNLSNSRFVLAVEQALQNVRFVCCLNGNINKCI